MKNKDTLLLEAAYMRIYENTETRKPAFVGPGNRTADFFDSALQNPKEYTVELWHDRVLQAEIKKRGDLNKNSELLQAIDDDESEIDKIISKFKEVNPYGIMPQPNSKDRYAATWFNGRLTRDDDENTGGSVEGGPDAFDRMKDDDENTGGSVPG